ncbi:MAG: hypothetical protein OI74_16875 [Gammaproteobacteria bacterium (ex Lamellibrachia satsuma)]|nr:MAG: hypothetical protein HPY30_00655 [Gammaproteobacteria bacterium (ex Lamellibrachia satsuma)]RRS30468.1 MAG: hypothetical protein OI74_16875 [Gammaproteobacteria bacterium (ex Lamellibrachia satsuma)]RRS37300.1 MAG: hypothetical protein NV67_01965 [Gammaproteobacteria bacterium (ex Lamellibrachia satsuma)]
MGIEKLLDSLNGYLKKAEKKKTAQCDEIDVLLKKLKEKKKKLEKKQSNEKNPTKKKRLSTELKIITLQLKKGSKRRNELKKKCE